MISESALSDAIAAAQTRWPGIKINASGLLAHLAKLEESTSGHVDTNRLEEIALCFACGSGDSVAIQAFETSYFSELTIALRKLDAKRGTFEEMRQLARHHLFVGAPGAAKVLTYLGMGSLRKWVRVVMTHLAINTLSREAPETAMSDKVLAALMGGNIEDPELTYIKQHYRNDLQTAFHEAFAQMSEEDQSLIQNAFYTRLSIDTLAVLYDIHRSTAARRVLKVRDELVTNVRAALKDRLHISSNECDSLLRFMRSQLEFDFDPA